MKSTIGTIALSLTLLAVVNHHKDRKRYETKREAIRDTKQNDRYQWEDDSDLDYSEDERELERESEQTLWEKWNQEIQDAQ